MHIKEAQVGEMKKTYGSIIIDLHSRHGRPGTDEVEKDKHSGKQHGW